MNTRNRIVPTYMFECHKIGDFFFFFFFCERPKLDPPNIYVGEVKFWSIVFFFCNKSGVQSKMVTKLSHVLVYAMLEPNFGLFTSVELHRFVTTSLELECVF